MKISEETRLRLLLAMANAIRVMDDLKSQNAKMRDALIWIRSHAACKTCGWCETSVEMAKDALYEDV